jgi:hypothetical protein
VDAWRDSYNRDRPHQSLDIAFPGDPSPPVPAPTPRGVWTPPQLQLVNRPQPALRQSLSCDDPKVKVVLSEDELVCSDAVEVDLEAGVWTKCRLWAYSPSAASAVLPEELGHLAPILHESSVGVGSSIWCSWRARFRERGHA